MMHAIPQTPAAGRTGPSRKGWPRGRILSAVFWSLLVLALGVCVVCAGMLLLTLRDNRLIAGLSSGRDLSVEESAVPEARFARAHFLMTRDRFEEAQIMVDRLPPGRNGVAAAGQYDLANARLRTALSLLEAGRIDAAGPLVRLAKGGYRRSLALDPGLWDAKYNLDVAMRLVRDFPQIDRMSEEEPADLPVRLWSDLPGLPRGLP
jgi:mxaK protein